MLLCVHARTANLGGSSIGAVKRATVERISLSGGSNTVDRPRRGPEPLAAASASGADVAGAAKRASSSADAGATVFRLLRRAGRAPKRGAMGVRSGRRTAAGWPDASTAGAVEVEASGAPTVDAAEGSVRASFAAIFGAFRACCGSCSAEIRAAIERGHVCSSQRRYEAV